MMGKKSMWLIFALVLSLLFTLSITGCGNNNAPASGAVGDDRWGEVHRWQLQTAVPAGDPHMEILGMLVDDIEKMSGGRLLIEILPADAVVGPFEILNAVDAGIVEAGQWWTHYATGMHPAAGLFNAPSGGAGTGLDQTGILKWHLMGGGRDLYVYFYQEILGMDVIPFIHAPDGPEALGWFHSPPANVEEFNRLRFRSPPGLPGEIYVEMGGSPVSMPGAEIIAAAERGVIDAAEWINPATDIRMGFQDVFSYYILGGLHQVIGMSDILINGDAWRALSPDLQAIVEVAAHRSIFNTYTWFTVENAIALEVLVDEYGIVLAPLPEGYTEAFLAAADRVFARHAAEEPFFAQVLASQREFAELILPYRVGNLATSYGMARFGVDNMD